ncbi:MAG: flagellar hook-basal body complex protein [Phycisphaerales bacterium]
MASTTALFTGLSGLTASARQLEVIGNNIANVNTPAFKANRLTFGPTFSRNLRLGSAPNNNSGGSNPTQVGLGVSIAGTQRNQSNGAISATGVPTDLALEGDGFFIVDRAGGQFYTRAGSFQFNSQNELVNIAGDRLQGYGVNDAFELDTSNLEAVNIQLGTLTVAEATRNVNLTGNLNADADIATQGTLITFGALYSDVALTVPILGTDLLTNVNGAGTVFALNDTITISGAERGGKLIEDATFTVTATSTIDDYMDFIIQALGIVPGGGPAASDPAFVGAEPGSYSISPAGEILLEGNWGEDNDLTLEAANFFVADSAGVQKTSPFNTTKTADADGESVRTTYVVYDSLGTALEVDVTMVLAYQDSSGTYWRTFLDSPSDTDLATHLESGDRTGMPLEIAPLVQFDNFGDLATPTSIGVEIDRTNTGAIDPLSFTLNFASGGDALTSLSNTGGESTLAATFQDGSPLGVLSSFTVSDDGLIIGGFSNGLARTIGQLAVATFTNPEGLIDNGDNLYQLGPNSGNALITTPLEFGTGRVIGGALELSNVDLSAEFINTILTSTGYSASSRVITTADELLQELLLIGR